MCLDIHVYKTPIYEIKQPKHEILPKIPMRSLLVGGSGSGKTLLLINIILNFYEGLFSKYYIFLPSIHVDDNWIPVKR